MCPTAVVSVLPTATTLPTPTVTPTPVLAPTPTNIPAGWTALATPHFSLAYPPDWTPETAAADTDAVIWAPANRDSVHVTAVLRADVTRYCLPEISDVRHKTFANLPMTSYLSGLGNSVRVWEFENAQQTRYLLSTGDMADAATKAHDEAILTTFRPDNADPWSC